MNQSMCTVEEAYQQSVQAIEDVLFTEENGKNRLEREMESAIYKALGKWLIAGGALILLSISSLYYTNRQELADIRRTANQNSQAINDDADRYSQKEHDAYAQYVEARFKSQNDDILEMKQDIKDIRSAVVDN